MADDKFGKISEEAAKAAALAGLAAGVQQLTGGDPGAIAAVGVIATGLAEWFKLATGRDDEGTALKVRLGAMEDQVGVLLERVAGLAEDLHAQGKKLDELDVLGREGVFSDFAKAVAEARSPAKREAIVNAAAHQFDPRLGEPHSRAYWFARVRALADIDVAVLRLLTDFAQIAFLPTVVMVREEGSAWRPHPLGPEDRVGINAAADALAQGSGDQAIERAHGILPVDGVTYSSYFYGLSVHGTILARFIGS